jgi:hypothetical protein
MVDKRVVPQLHGCDGLLLGFEFEHRSLNAG